MNMKLVQEYYEIISNWDLEKWDWFNDGGCTLYEDDEEFIRALEMLYEEE